jgi:hypothetical protein
MSRAFCHCDAGSNLKLVHMKQTGAYFRVEFLTAESLNCLLWLLLLLLLCFDSRQMFVRILSSGVMPMILSFSTLACYMKFVIFLTEMEQGNLLRASNW